MTWGKHLFQKDCMETNLSILSSGLCLHLYRHRTFHYRGCKYENHRCRAHIRVDIMCHNGPASHWCHLSGCDILIQTSTLSSSYYRRYGQMPDMCDTENHILALERVYLKAESQFDIVNWCLCMCRLGILGPQVCYRVDLSLHLELQSHLKTMWLSLRKSWWIWWPLSPDQWHICLPS